MSAPMTAPPVNRPLAYTLFALATALAVNTLLGPEDSPAARRWIAGALLGLAAFVVLVQWLPVLADITGGQPSRADYLESPTMTWTIVLLDLGIAVPAAVAAGVGLLRRAAWARTAAYATIGFFALVGPAVAAMAITMQVNDDPNAAAGNVVLMTLVGLLLAGLGVAVYRPLLRRDVGTKVPRRSELLPS